MAAGDRSAGPGDQLTAAPLGRGLRGPDQAAGDLENRAAPAAGRCLVPPGQQQVGGEAVRGDRARHLGLAVGGGRLARGSGVRDPGIGGPGIRGIVVHGLPRMGTAWCERGCCWRGPAWFRRGPRWLRPLATQPGVAARPARLIGRCGSPARHAMIRFLCTDLFSFGVALYEIW